MLPDQAFSQLIASLKAEIKREVLKEIQNHQPLEDKRFDLTEAAEYAGISESTLRRLANAKKIRHIRAGVEGSRRPTFLFRQSALDAWMHEQEELNYCGPSHQSS